MKKLLYTTIAILGFANFTMAQVPSYVPTNGLVGYWPFNGNANDESGNGNNGTVNGATLTNDRFGITNSSYDFNGINNYIRVANKSSLNNQSTSISGWFYSRTLPTNDNDSVRGIIGKWWQTPSLCGSNYNSYLVCLTKPIAKSPTLGCATNVYAGNIFTSNTTISGNSWHHFTFVHQKSVGGKIYINGQLLNSNTFGDSICSSINDLIIGADVKTGNLYRFFNGKIDDIGIWNRALTSQEIGVLYIGCIDTIINQPSNLSGAKGTNKTFSFTHSGTGYINQWQSNSTALGWQNVPNANQYSGVTTNSLAVNGLTVSNHNQLFRVITSKSGCADTSNVVKLTVSDVATDSLNVISLKTDTTTKGNTIRQLQTDLANKQDTLYVGSTITTDTLKISIRTGISTASPVINLLKVYPNPASTLLNIVLEKPGYYVAKLSSVTGQSIIAPTSGTIDISALANGVYILTIYDSNNKLISTNKVSIIK